MYIQWILEDFKGERNIPGIKSAKKQVFITKIKNKKGECITSRKGIADVFGEFYNRLYEDKEKDESEHAVNDDDNYSNTDVHNNTRRDGKNPRDNDRRVAHRQSTNSKKGKSEPKTLKHVMMKREKWWDKSSKIFWD